MDGEIRHTLDEMLENGDIVEGAIDWQRRFDHMQQHAGQHMLTAAFVELFGFPTVSFHLGKEMVSIDLNLVGINPLIGKNNDDLGTRFPDVSEVYNKELRNVALQVAKEQHITLREGVYGWWSGPVYETPAEIRMIRILGADAIGMSTVPEAVVAIHSGLKVLGISCLTNMACGILDEPLSHEDVIEVAAKSRSTFIRLIKNVLKEI